MPCGRPRTSSGAAAILRHSPAPGTRSIRSATRSATWKTSLSRRARRATTTLASVPRQLCRPGARGSPRPRRLSPTSPTELRRHRDVRVTSSLAGHTVRVVDAVYLADGAQHVPEMLGIAHLERELGQGHLV